MVTFSACALPSRSFGPGFVALAAVLAITVPLSGTAAVDGPAPLPVEEIATGATPLPVEEIAPGVMLHVGRQEVWSAANGGDVANLAFVVGSECVAVIDSGGSPALGARMLAAVRARTPLPVCYVIHTHVHPDHVLGAAAFAALEPRPRFVAHARFAASLAARAGHYLAAAERELGHAQEAADIVFPDIEVADTLELDLGGRALTLRAWPTAHTDNDLTVHERATGVLFLGDLLFAGHLPVLDGRLLGWLAVMDELAELEIALAVPGHGPPSRAWPAALQLQRDYLDGLRDQVRAALRAGRTLAETVNALGETGTDTWLLADEFHRRNLTAAYAELEWED